MRALVTGTYLPPDLQATRTNRRESKDSQLK
jgi:hypothetical protein